MATQRALGSCPLPAASFRDIDFENNSHPDMTLTAFAVDWALKTEYLYFENNKFDYKYQNKLHFVYISLFQYLKSDKLDWKEKPWGDTVQLTGL